MKYLNTFLGAYFDGYKYFTSVLNISVETKTLNNHLHEYIRMTWNQVRISGPDKGRR